ncbi:MAG: MBOAT family protein [Treponema sp.]|nr:MBOAT family protein [Treponema sp.]
MLFSSITFLCLFLPAVLVFYYALPGLTYRNCVLFLASLLFYAWGEPKYVFLMFSSIVFNYNMGLRLGENRQNKKQLLAFAIIANISVLFIFKYLGFTCHIINRIIESLNLKPLSDLNLIMPIGISFYTFQEISYLVDVYRKPEQAQKSLLKLGLYITFFPQLIAGPIVRYHDINEQISSRSVNIEIFSYGLQRFIVGLGKKVLLANTFALVCDGFYNADLFSYDAQAAWIAAFSYSLQIYYDFSGYSDMAIGLASLFGFKIDENFNYPYAATSITDFWKRWHISLTNFFRDYVYIPLGGNRKGSLRTVLNRFIVFFTTGLWHGAAFNFIIWGLAHGSLMTAEKTLKGRLSKKGRLVLSALSRIYTLFSVMVLWVVFRNGTKKSIKILLKMAGINYTRFTSALTPIIKDGFLYINIDRKFWITFAAGIMFSFPWWRKIGFLYTKNNGISKILLILRYLALATIFILCYANLADNSYNPFIYFRF